MTANNTTDVIIENATILPEASWSDPLVIVTLLLALGTFALAFFTSRVLNETKKTRTDPVFALEPTKYYGVLNEPAGEHFRGFNIVNHGAAATDILATYDWRENEKVSGHGDSVFIISLAKDSYAGLNIPELEVKNIISQKQFLRVEITCKNAAGKKYSTVITSGLDKIRGKSTKIAFQGNHWQTIYTALDNINLTLQLKLKS